MKRDDGNIDDCDAEAIVALYRKRLWCEAMSRDLKNRNWGMGMDVVRLSSVERTETHFIIMMIAYILLCAFGAFAEVQNFGETLIAISFCTMTLILELGLSTQNRCQCRSH